MAVVQGLATLFYIISVTTCVWAADDCRDLALGMQNSVLPADKITASSGTAGDQARLNYINGPSWCAMGNDDNPYLQIDLLGTPHIICAVSTQGEHQTKRWVKTFQLNCSNDGKTYHPYKENGNAQQTFYGNVDNSGIVKQILYQGIIARYLRILPTMHHGAVCMRAEIYGVKLQSASKVNYAYHKTATQSSTGWDAPPDRAVDGNRNPNFDSVKSCTHTEMQDNEPWWMVDLGQSIPVYEVFIVNRKRHHERLHDFLILIGWSSSNGGKSNPVCNSVQGALPPGIGTSIYCHQSMMGRFLTITFDNHAGYLTLCEVEVYTEGLAIFISNSSAVPDNRMSASSNYSNTRTAAKARLLGNYSWRPRDDDTNPWLQIDLAEIYYVCAVATQGDPDGDERTIKYKVEGSIDNLLWMPVESKTLKKEMVFTGNENKSTSIIKHSLPSPLAARFVRFYPVEKIEAHALRVEIYGVLKEPALPIPTQIGEKSLQPSHSAYVDLVCRAERGLSIKWYHNDTDITSYSIGSVRTGSTLISTLRVNYTSAEDVYDKYSCDKALRNCTSLDYICQVDYGSYRKLQSRGKISTLLVPTRPRHLNATIIPQRGTQRPTVTLKWEKPMRAIGKTTSYTLFYNYVIDNNSNMTSLIITDFTSMSYTINVIGGARFEFYLKAKANGLIGDPSQTWTANIQECKPSSAPANVKVIKIDNGKYNVSWEEIPRELSNGKIIAYEINWSSLTRRMRRSPVVSRAANASESPYMLVSISLTDNMKYNLTVRGYTIGGPGPFSETIVLKIDECRDLALGMQNRVIPADKITTSSGTAGDQARLNYTNGPSWCAMGNDTSPHLQIDLGTPHIICAVSTQGDQQTKRWVKAFQLNCSDDGKTYHPYREHGNTQQTFYGNVDNSGIVKQILYQGVIARYLRILPIMHHGAVCMRAEIYGVKIQSASKVNYAYHKTATQSSTYPGGPPDRAIDGNRNPYFYAKSCTHTQKEREAWWMVDLGQSVPVYEVFIVNRDSNSDRLHDFLIFIGGSSSNGGKLNPVCNSVKGPLPSGIGTSIYCHQSMMGRFLTITFDNHVGFLTLCEVEVHTEDYTRLAIGVSDSSAVPDNRMSASSIYSNTRTAAKARLLGNNSWRPRNNDTNPWLQIDLAEIYYVCAVATQSDPNSDERTIKYKVKGSIDNLLWVPVKSKTLEKEMVFTGNENKSTNIIKHSLPSPLAARFVRFYPVGKIKAYALRVEIYGVTKVPVPPIPPPIGSKELHPSHGSHADLVCRAEGGLSIKWYHNDTDITSYSIGSLRTGSILISTLRVNYTSAEDVYDKYSCDKTQKHCTSLDYICQVDYGSYRKLQSRGEISTLLVPTRPRHVNAKINPQLGTQRPTVTLKWEKPMRAIGEITSYTLFYNYVTDNNISMKSLTITDFTSMSYTINVIGGARFEFYLKAKANDLIGDPSETWTANIQECKPSSAPANTKVIKIDNGKYNVSWDEIPRELSNGKNIAYEINWFSLARRKRRSPVASRAANASESPYILLNISLTDNMKYNLTVRGYTIAGPGPFSDPIVLKKEIKKAERGYVDKSVPDSVIAVAVVFCLLFVVGMIVFIFWYKRRKGQEDTPQQENPGGQETHNPVPVDKHNQNEKQNEGNIEMVEVEGDAIYENTTEKIGIHLFPDFMNRVRRNEHELLMHQFKILSHGRLYPCTVAMKPINKSKNRYGNVIPYDNSRVVLEKLEGDEDSDYINASYIRGYDCKQISYIATQGPLPQTVNDFWRMIWQEKMSVIVMLTGIKEQNKIKCEKYWPEKSKKYEDLSVHLHKTEVFADYSIRTFVVSKMKTKEQRYVFQYHFTAWPDKGVPQHATQLLAFRKRLESDTAMGSPWVVHCSAGVGRTGAFLAIDAMIRQARDYKTIDVFNFVKTMRQNRQDMVQTKEQYLFIHMAILEHLTCGITEIQAHQLGKMINKLTIYDRKEEISGFEKEFKHLSALCPDVPKNEMKHGRKNCNSKKNRFQHILPVDKARVILQADTDEEGTDYINASYANAYRQKDAYILTQAPLDNTLADFWKMIYDNKLGTIVMLNKNKEEKMSYPPYWPEKGSLEFGNIRVEIVKEETENCIVSREFNLTHNHKSDGPNKPHKVRHLQHTGWSDGSVPGTTTSVLDLVEKIQRSQQHSENKLVVVLCSDGVGRSGTLCTILSLLDRVKTEQMVDVFQTVKSLRISRPGAVETAIQYQFCFQVVMDYLESFSEYANFNG